MSTAKPVAWISADLLDGEAIGLVRESDYLAEHKAREAAKAALASLADTVASAIRNTCSMPHPDVELSTDLRPLIWSLSYEANAQRARVEAAEAKIAELNSINSKLCEMMDEELEDAKEWEAKAEAAEADAKRLDYLERELEVELACVKAGRPYPLSLFRRNMPITRAAIDAAMQEAKK